MRAHSLSLPRWGLLGIVALFHVIAFILLDHFCVWHVSPVAEPFLQVAVPPDGSEITPTTPIQPIEPLPTQGANVGSGLPALGEPNAPEIAPSMTTIQIAETTQTLLRSSLDNLRKRGTAHGSILGHGTGGKGASAIAIIGGMEISGSSIIVTDTSGSMDAYAQKIEKFVTEKYPDFKVIHATSSYGNARSEADTPRWPDHPGTKEEDFNTDLYAASYKGIALYGVENVYIFSDFVDGEQPAATAQFIQTLKQRGVRLYLSYVGNFRPWPTLRAYAEQTGACAEFKETK